MVLDELEDVVGLVVAVGTAVGCPTDSTVSIDRNYSVDCGNATEVEDENEVDVKDADGDDSNDCFRSNDCCSNGSVVADTANCPTNVSNSVRSFYFASRYYANSNGDHCYDDRCLDWTNRSNGF